MSNKFIDLTGKQFGFLKVLKKDEIKSYGAHWVCLCENCQEIVSVRSDCLRKRNQQSCGCTVRNFKIGDKINMLTIIKYIGNKPLNHKRRRLTNFWLCRCECGNYTEISTGDLNIKKIKSCGCIKKYCKITKQKNNTKIPLYFFKRFVKGAEIRQIEFLISINDAWNQLQQQNFKCSLSGIELLLPSNSRKNNGTASLDRIDSNKGYTIDNIQWVHKDINIMKNKMSQEKFIEYCKLIAKNNK